MAITVTPLSPALGAEIGGVDLSQPADLRTLEQIHRAWLDHLVIVIRGQTLDEPAQERFASFFGELQEVRSRPGERKPNEHVMIIGNVTVDGRKGELPEGELQFHADQCYYEAPSKATLLYAIEVPSSGGNTLFSNTYLAFDSLPPELQRRLEQLDCFFLYDYNNAAAKRSGPISQDAPQFTHPAVVRHPETGKPSLFVNRLMSDHLVGVDAEESQAILDELYAVQERPEFVYEHVWRPGDLVMWDNRCTLHARTDFDPSERRFLRRMTVKGDRPIAARAAA
ncbi:MAG: TauD/TfdA family dioxygenase [Bauldia litoralis]